MQTATAISNPNIAFIKYWGNRDERLVLPQNPSLSMNLDGLYARTSVTFHRGMQFDTLTINAEPAAAAALNRVSRFLDSVRALAGTSLHAQVESVVNFPIGAGIASSAAAFAALSLAAAAAAGLDLSEKDLSRLARLGSGSAARSVPGGFVEWQTGTGDADSYAFSIAPASHWDLVDCIAIAAAGQKPVGSSEGHTLAGSSLLQPVRVASAPHRLENARAAILARDFPALAEVIELDSNLMHAVMITSRPSLLYWEPASIEIMKSVQKWRAGGLPCCYTLDAGPNVHVLCPAQHASQVAAQLRAIPGVSQVLSAHPGGPAVLLADPS